MINIHKLIVLAASLLSIVFNNNSNAAQHSAKLGHGVSYQYWKQDGWGITIGNNTSLMKVHKIEVWNSGYVGLQRVFKATELASFGPYLEFGAAGENFFDNPIFSQHIGLKGVLHFGHRFFAEGIVGPRFTISHSGNYALGSGTSFNFGISFPGTKADSGN